MPIIGWPLVCVFMLALGSKTQSPASSWIGDIYHAVWLHVVCNVWGQISCFLFISRTWIDYLCFKENLRIFDCTHYKKQQITEIRNWRRAALATPNNQFTLYKHYCLYLPLFGLFLNHSLSFYMLYSLWSLIYGLDVWSPLVQSETTWKPLM